MHYVQEISLNQNLKLTSIILLAIFVNKNDQESKNKTAKPKKYFSPLFPHKKTYFNVYHWLNNIRCLIHSVVELRI